MVPRGVPSARSWRSAAHPRRHLRRDNHLGVWATKNQRRALPWILNEVHEQPPGLNSRLQDQNILHRGWLQPQKGHLHPKAKARSNTLGDTQDHLVPIEFLTRCFQNYWKSPWYGAWNWNEDTRIVCAWPDTHKVRRWWPRLGKSHTKVQTEREPSILNGDEANRWHAKQHQRKDCRGLFLGTELSKRVN